jgi:hypothetical protein
MRQYRTLETLRTEMKAVLGHGAAGSASGLSNVILDAHLRDAQTLLYWTHDWAHLRKYETKSLGVDQHLIDYPLTANPDRIKAISVLSGSVWSPPVPKGIAPQLYTTQDNKSSPQRWEPYEQIEVWPKADQVYSLRIFFIKALERFEQDQDRATIDDTLIATVAKGTLKAHYRQPDAAVYQDTAKTLLLTLKAKSWGQSVFRTNDFTEEEPMAKPVVV